MNQAETLELVACYMPHVYGHARRLRGKQPHEDAVSEGKIGLFYAIAKGRTAPSQISWHIKEHILNYVYNNSSIVRPGNSDDQERIFYQLNKVIAKRKTMGLSTSTEALAQELRVSPKLMLEAQQRLLNKDFDPKIYADNSYDIEDAIDTRHFLPIVKRCLSEFMDTLTFKERRTFNGYFGEKARYSLDTESYRHFVTKLREFYGRKFAE